MSQRQRTASGDSASSRGSRKGSIRSSGSSIHDAASSMLSSGTSIVFTMAPSNLLGQSQSQSQLPFRPFLLPATPSTTPSSADTSPMDTLATRPLPIIAPTRQQELLETVASTCRPPTPTIDPSAQSLGVTDSRTLGRTKPHLMVIIDSDDESSDSSSPSRKTPTPQPKGKARATTAEPALVATPEEINPSDLFLKGPEVQPNPTNASTSRRFTPPFLAQVPNTPAYELFLEATRDDEIFDLILKEAEEN